MARTYPKIGSDARGTMLSMQGVVNPASEGIAEFSRGGMDYKGYQKMGLRPEPFTLITAVGLALLTDISDRIDFYKSLEGTLVTLIDNSAVTWTNILIRRVEAMPEQTGARLAIVGGTTTVNPSGAKAMLYAQWTCEVTSNTTHT